MSRRARVSIFAGLCLASLAAAAAYLALADRREAAEAQARPAVAEAPAAAGINLRGRLVFRSTSLASYGKVAAVPLSSPAQERRVAELECERIHVRDGRGLCLQADRGAITTYEAVTLGEGLRPQARFPLAGPPSRARVGPGGRLAAYTVFVTGHSYAQGGFSTRTAIVDVETGAEVAELETFTVRRGDRVLRSPDFNFWGVTFADDGRTFYATLGTGGHTYLVAGDVRARSARVLRDGVECPSLSPDGTRIAFKKRVTRGIGPVSWRVAVLDLATGEERVLAETRSVDDQVEWLDDDRIAYGLQRAGSAVSDVWFVRADGTGKPVRLLEAAWSPAAAAES